MKTKVYGKNKGLVMGHFLCIKQLSKKKEEGIKVVKIERIYFIHTLHRASVTLNRKG